MDQGWVYVLVNSSIPGMAKVGRTARPAAERAAELSSATGVATPFVVAFEQSFFDCCLAERAIHAELDRRGWRIAANREFFRGAPSDIIRVILDIADGAPDMAAASSCAAERLREAGDRAYFGEGDTLQDTGEALRYYRLAAERGSPIAYERMGRIFNGLHMGSRHRAYRRRTLTTLKEGARRGNYYCYCELAELFATEGHVSNFRKSWDLFFARRHDAYCADVEAGQFAAACGRYVVHALPLVGAPWHVEILRDQAEAILVALMAALNAAPTESRGRTADALRWAYESLLPPLPPEHPARRSRLHFFARPAVA